MRIPAIAITLLVGYSLGALTARGRCRPAVPEDLIRGAHDTGYRKGLMHAALGLLDTPGGDGGSAAATSYARGHMRVVTDNATERKRA